MSLTTDWTTRPETSADRKGVHGVNAAAFETEAEAKLVDALREDPDAWLPGLSYVAVAPDGAIAAYALITRCHVDQVPALAPAPVAVLPDHRRQGAGGAVVRAVLEAARARGAARPRPGASRALPAIRLRTCIRVRHPAGFRRAGRGDDGPGAGRFPVGGVRHHQVPAAFGV